MEWNYKKMMIMVDRVTLVWIILLSCNSDMVKLVLSDAGINFLNEGCSTYKVSSFSDFSSNLNSSFAYIKTQINSGKTFVTVKRLTAPDPVYAMLQCRDYMSAADCLTCFNVASIKVRNCSSAIGGRVIYDGCFLRYESSEFYGEGTQDANREFCGKKKTTVAGAAAFTMAVEALLNDLQIATPKINNLYAASKRDVIGNVNSSVYGIAQCVQTIDSSGCLACLQVAFTNLKSCTPNTEGRAVDSGCFMRYSSSSFFAVNQTTDLLPFLKTASSGKKRALIGGVSGGVGLLSLIILLIIWFNFSRKRSPRANDILGATELKGPMNYRYKDLKSATKNFKEENKLGEGGFGEVFKGTLKNGKIVAVKKLNVSQSRRVVADFASEVTLISNVHHRNLVRLLGCCSKGPELLLVYEYMANSSLDRFLFGKKQGTLSWKQRLDVIIGTAQGLSYLHEQFHVCIIHRDIKPNNILLDDDFQPKIADFGLARLLPDDQTHLSTRFAGTLGYTAPEYAVHGQLSEKADTYSYGVVVLEVISGRKSNDTIKDPNSDYLLKWAWKMYENGTHLELVDESIDRNEYDAEEMKKIIEIALLCTQASHALRPTMSEVVVMIKSRGSIEHRAPPTKPPFIEAEVINVSHNIHGGNSTSTASSNSNATASVTQLSAR